MQPCRLSTRLVPRAARAPNPTRTMFTTPFFPHMGSEFAPFFRVFDSAVADLVPSSPRRAAQPSFTPRFDVREIGSTYELQGELPGLERNDLDIEFVDERTLVIRGKASRDPTTSGSHSDAASTQVKDTNEAISDTTSERSANYHKASVEDEYVDAGAETEKSNSSAPAHADATEESKVLNSAVDPAFKYWVSERSVGQFERRFAFPGRVDQAAVRASLKNGILSVVVPKVVEKEARRIEIQ